MWWFVGFVTLCVVLWAARRLVHGVPLYGRGTRGGRREVRTKDDASLQASYASWVDGPPAGGTGGWLG